MSFAAGCDKHSSGLVGVARMAMPIGMSSNEAHCLNLLESSYPSRSFVSYFIAKREKNKA